MRILTAAVALAAVITGFVPVASRADPVADDAHQPATITVTGQGRVSRLPDRATVALTIVTNDDSAARALSENNRRFSMLSSKVAAGGIAAGDVISTSISSYYNPRPATPSPNTAGQLFGYVVTRSAQINVNALSATGSVVDAATAAGATQINGVSYGFRDRSSLERAALAAAVNDAYEQAQTIAGAAHVRIVRMLRATNGDGSPGRLQPLMAMARSAEPTPTTIAPSELDVASTVSITYIIR